MVEVRAREQKREERPLDPDLKRPIDPKRVLKILEFRRKTAEFIEAMLEPTISEEELNEGKEFICQDDYDSISQERSLLKLCGYPLCSNSLTREWKQKYHISLREKRIYDVEVRKLYCSVKCMDNSITYKGGIPEQPIWMRFYNKQTTSSDFNFGILTSNP